MLTKIVGLFMLSAAAHAQTAGIEGIWQGTIEASGTKLRLAFHISKDDKGGFVTKWDSIDQGAMDLPVRQTTFADNKLHFQINAATSFDGTFNAAGNEIAGTFTQGAGIPLVLKRIEKVDALNRPQNPKPPFPYDSEDVTYQNKAAGVTLAGTITKPRGAGPFPAALMITGSGPQDRDETLLGHRPFWVIADYLTRRGIAVLRIDDRGMGKSTGNSVRTTMSEMADDVLTGVEFLKARKEIDAKHIGVIGHSEGGIVGPLAASRSQDISFVVMLAGTGVPGEQVMYLQSEMIMRVSGAGDAAAAQNHKLQEMMFNIVREAKDEKDDAAILAKLRDAWAKFPGPTDEQRKAGTQAMNAEFNRILAPELRSFLFLDPAEALRKVKAPVLALNGSRDVQVLPQQNLPAIVRALTEGGNSDFMVAELPGLNHLFQKCKTCAPSEYGDLEESFSPAALEIVGDWITRHTRSQ
jgi:pimeloyl-ACP methyl ester carboxylesterase